LSADWSQGGEIASTLGAGEAHAWLRGYRAAQLEAMRDD
jgi:hypothetical protein